MLSGTMSRYYRVCFFIFLYFFICGGLWKVDYFVNGCDDDGLLWGVGGGGGVVGFFFFWGGEV